ncbi:DUF1847 domain-containing protein [bacterium]|nr:DUF1847 domain-containing protein [bacterium]
MTEVYSEKALEKASKIYETDEGVKKSFEASNALKAEGKGQWTRIQEVLSYIKHMGYEKVGLAYCAGLKGEADTLTEIFAGNGVELSRIGCSVGGKGCNPVGQAMTLNEIGADFNIAMGLCMGHDILFQQFSDAPVTVLAIKDRVAFHNPVAPLYNTSWRRKLSEKALG